MIAHCFAIDRRRSLARLLYTTMLMTTAFATTAFWAGSTSAGQLDTQIKSNTEISDATDEILDETEDGDGKMLVVPVPIVDPTIGNGLALAGLYTFPAGNSDDGTPRSTLGIGGGYTDTESWMVGSGLKLYLDGDSYRVGLNAGYGNFNLKYYGISSNSPFFDNPVGFLVRGALFDGSVQMRVADNLYGGLKALYTKPEVTLDSPIDLEPELKRELELAAVGVTGEYDTRDSIWYPASGSLGRIELLRYVGLGSDKSFPIVDADYSKYWGLSENIVLGGNVRAAQAGDDTPFFMLPFLSIRGFPAGRYMNQSVIQVQGELRWKFWREFGAVFFGGAGIAAPSFRDLEDGGEAYGVGGGLRYRISDVDNMNIGLDVAYSRSDDVVVYFRVGEAF